MDSITVKFKTDKEGYFGRECPECEKYFKIINGTGIPGNTDCYCPYCRHFDPHDRFYTREQVEYAQSFARHQVSSYLVGKLKELERKPKPNEFLSLGITVKSNIEPVFNYFERELEEKLTCTECTLQYAIYGVFAVCPDCGKQNTGPNSSSQF